MKKCYICKTEKPSTDFYKGQYKCKTCHKSYMRDYYRKNPAKRESHVSRSKNRARKTIRFFKETRPCTDCGLYWPYYVMQFDHLEDKKFTISNKVGGVSMESLWNEIRKCELVCANCHAIRTHNRRIGEKCI